MMETGADPIRELLDLIPESVVLRDRSGAIVAWNSASEALYGLPAEAAIGRAAAEILGADADGALETLQATGAWQGEAVRRGADGAQRIVDLRWRPRADGGIVETGRDITLARHAEDALRKSEHRYRNLFQAMAASFWELDFFPVGQMLHRLKKSGALTSYDSYFAEHPEFVREMMRATRVVDVNDQTVALFGRGDKAELLSTVEPFWPEASSGVYAASVAAAVTGALNYASETVLRTIDGREFPALFTACFPPDTMNKGTLLVGVIDLSEQVAAKLALDRMQNEMAHAARVSILGELAASIAHEVNQPLGAIATNAAAGQRWLDRPVPNLDELRALNARIGADARRAADIVARIRAMASGGEAQPGAVPLNAVVVDAAAFLGHEIRHSGVRLRLALSPASPEVLGDRVQLQQVVVNLAMNAVQAMAGRDIKLLTIYTQVTEGSVMLTVEDSGPGIPDADLPRIFDSFFTTRPSGMGMGLAIVRGIVTRLGGTIAAENLIAGGARFRIVLPPYATVATAHTKV